MSSTRKAEPGKPFRQERYCSSAELERGLMANLVAMRSEVLDDPADRGLIWFLQLLSHREGGLKQLATNLRDEFSERIGTKSMRKFGISGKNYNAEQVKSVRAELRANGASQFLLRGEREHDMWEFLAKAKAYLAEDANKHPISYPVSDFLTVCNAAAGDLESDLKKLCLDPAGSLESGPWYFHELIDCLREIQTEWIEARRAATVVTELGRLVYDTLDFTLESKCLTLIDGLARTGKTFSVKAWCELHPGRARYVQVPSTNDEIGFYRAIAKGLGVSITLNSKAQALRQRIEEVLQRGDLAIVFDEASFLWPNSSSRDVLPVRINWIMTALANHGVPVSLVTTPQFLRSQKVMERKSCWTSEQFIGRIGHYQKLPDSLAEADLNKVAGALLPEGDAWSREILVRYAQGSAKYLAGIECVVRRARYLASKEARTKVSAADIKRAVQDSVIPSDSALAQAIAEPEKRSRKRGIQAPLTTVSRPLQPGAGTEEETEDFVRPPPDPLCARW